MNRSYSFILILFLALAAHTGANGQEAAPECPKLEVLDPQGVVSPGDSVDFHVTISPATDVPVQMIWTVSEGVIEKARAKEH
jgi:hypothetical protein